MDTVLLGWPLITPLLALTLLAWLFREPRAPGSGSRWHDPAFLLPLVWPMYLLHQFEAHGYDAHGKWRRVARHMYTRRLLQVARYPQPFARTRPCSSHLSARQRHVHGSWRSSSSAAAYVSDVKRSV